MNVYTLTLNPAFDLHASSDNFRVGSENLIKINTKDAGGKGINISRALSAFGCFNTAINILGNENAEEFSAMLKREKLNCINIVKNGRIRENLTIHSDKETRISYPGFELDGSIFNEITPLFDSVSDSIITFTGSVPNGVDKSSVITFLKGLKNLGARLVIDSKSLTLEDIAEINPWLIKPNEEEIEHYTGEKTDSIDKARIKAGELQKTVAENVIISLGGKGAVLADNNGCFSVNAPKIVPLSTVGAGDTMIAGFIYSFTCKKNDAEALKFAVAAGSAACLTEGTAAPTLDSVNNLLKQIL